MKQIIPHSVYHEWLAYNQHASPVALWDNKDLPDGLRIRIASVPGVLDIGDRMSFARLCVHVTKDNARATRVAVDEAKLNGSSAEHIKDLESDRFRAAEALRKVTVCLGYIEEANNPDNTNLLLDAAKFATESSYGLYDGVTSRSEAQKQTMRQLSEWLLNHATFAYKEVK